MNQLTFNEQTTLQHSYCVKRCLCVTLTTHECHKIFYEPQILNHVGKFSARSCSGQFMHLPRCLWSARCNLLQFKIKFKNRSVSLSCTDGCPGLCNGNGQCILGQNSWHCECHTGWRGTGCNVAMEISCNDNKDNEGGENQFQPTIRREPRKTLKSYSKTRFCGGIR